MENACSDSGALGRWVRRVRAAYREWYSLGLVHHDEADDDADDDDNTVPLHDKHGDGDGDAAGDHHRHYVSDSTALHYLRHGHSTGSDDHGRTIDYYDATGRYCGSTRHDYGDIPAEDRHCGTGEDPGR